MTGPLATRIFRIIFLLAGFYNLLFGLWAALRPLDFFRIFQIAPPIYPQIWGCLGMVVGIYGLLYWYAAWKPEHGKPIIAIGLLGKILGPIGMAINIGNQWPRRLGMLNVYNDVIWLVPFALFLLRGTKAGRALMNATPEICAGIHTLGLVAMVLLLRPGVAAQPVAMQRAVYISQHVGLWTIGWSIWMCCAICLVAMYAWWGSRLAAWRMAMVGIVVAAAGCIFDLSGESLSAFVLVERAISVVSHPDSKTLFAFGICEKTITALTAGLANTLYTLGGIVLICCTPNLPRALRATIWTTLIAGIAMTFAAVFNSVPGMVIATVVLFPSLIIWTLWLGRLWRMT